LIIQTGNSALEAPAEGGLHDSGLLKPGRNSNVTSALILDVTVAAWWPRILALPAKATHLHALPFRAVPVEARER
jgi:hypothetical protein